MSEQRDMEREARNLITPAVHDALATLQESGMLTGYVLAMEFMADDGQYRVHWLTGDGNPAEEGREAGLMHHRVAGILWKVEADVRAHNAGRNE